MYNNFVLFLMIYLEYIYNSVYIFFEVNKFLVKETFFHFYYLLSFNIRDTVETKNKVTEARACYRMHSTTSSGPA